jgi:hypothetical protein
VRTFWLAFVPLAGTVGTLAALHAAGIGAASLIVLGAALCLRTARRPAGRPVDDLIRLPVVVAATAGLGLLFARTLLDSAPALHAALLDPDAGTRARVGATVRAVNAGIEPG